MELKDFLQNVLKDIVDGVQGATDNSSYEMNLQAQKDSYQTVEFDIAVTVEDSVGGNGKAGIKVFQFVEGGAGLSREIKNSSVSRVKFGVNIRPKRNTSSDILDTTLTTDEN